MFRLTRSPAVPANVIEPVSPALGIVSRNGAPFAVSDPEITLCALPARLGRRLRPAAPRLRVSGFVAGASCESTTRAAPLCTPTRAAETTTSARQRRAEIGERRRAELRRMEPDLPFPSDSRVATALDWHEDDRLLRSVKAPSPEYRAICDN